jgi:AraC-like DNA-binding protein
MRKSPARPSMRDGVPAPIFVMRQSGDARSGGHSTVTHQYATLSFYTGGRSRLEQRGRWTLRAGDVLLVPAGEPHRILEKDRPEMWGLGFCVPCFAAGDAGALLDPFERVREGASAVVHIPTERRDFLERLFRELQQATDPGGRVAPEAVQRSLLTLILDEVARASSSAAAATVPAGVVLESLRFIERNCLRPLTLKDVARAVGKNPAYVTTTLSRATGRSAVEWIIAGRLAQARRMLLHSDERIDAIAERVGYADPTHFIRLFRREHGATPSAWRAARRRPALSV